MANDVKNLLSKLMNPQFKGSLSHSIYEYCYYLSLNSTISEEQNQYLENIRFHIKKDGLLGESQEVNYLFDEIIVSLSSILALSTHNKLDIEIRNTFNKSLLSHLLKIPFSNKNKKTIAFEALAHDLLNRCEKRGILSKKIIIINKVLKLIVKKKLQKKINTLYTNRSTIHSVLDAFQSNYLVQWNEVAKLQENNGSMGIYPSSTIALMSHLDEKDKNFSEAKIYIDSVFSANNNTLVPFFPSEEFERWWSLFYLADSPLKDLVKNSVNIKDMNCEIAVSSDFSLADLDTSAMKASTLLLLGKEISLDFLSNYYEKGIFKCYENEDRISPSANIHGLMAIKNKYILKKQLSKKEEIMFDTVLNYLLSFLNKNSYYTDKWHLSDLYTTSHAIELFNDILQEPHLSKGYEKTLKDSISKLVDYMNNYYLGNNGWGTQGFSTKEETSYAIRSLSRIGQIIPPIDIKSFEKLSDAPLWLGKTLYSSEVINMGLYLSAQSMLE